MALQTAAYLSGKIDNVVFYKRSGTYIARATPAIVKQTEATKIRSRNFGIASAAGKTLRHLLFPALPYPKDKSMQSRFSGAIAQWLKLQDPAAMPPVDAIPYVSGFNFNESTSVAERWKTAITITQTAANELALQLPAFIPADTIAAPAHTTEVICTIATACCHLAGGQEQGSFTETLHIPYTGALQPATTIVINVPTATGNIIVTAIALTYLLANGQQETRAAFMPASVVDARYC